MNCIRSKNSIPKCTRTKPGSDFLIFEVVILKVEKDIPDIRFLAFYGHIDRDKFSIVTVGPEGFAPGVDYGGIGIKKEALTYLAAHKSQAATDPVAVLRKSVAQEVSLYPRFVGLPVSILELTSTGYSWKDKGGCQ
jgi:hypothetical protein